MEGHPRGEVVNVYNYEQGKLDEHFNQVGYNDGEWNNQSWEVNFSKNGLVRIESIRAFTETVLKVVPADKACQVEHGLRNSISRYSCNATKHEHKHDGGKQWLYNKP